MDILDAIVKIIVGLFALTGVCLSVYFGWKQFSIKRADEKEDKSIKLQIDNAISAARKEITEEINTAVKQGIVECGVIGDKAIRETQNELDKQIAENSKQIGELTVISKGVLEKMDVMSNKLNVVGESNKNNNYDRLLIVTNKILKSGKMTIADKTNLKQLYQSWKDLNGEDPKMETMYDECMRINPILDEGA